MTQPLGVKANDTSMAFTWGLNPSSVLTDIGSTVMGWISKGFMGAQQLLKSMRDGALAIVESIKKGNFIDLLKGLLKDNPVAAAAAGVAVILIGGVVVAAVGAGIAAICGAIASAGILTQAALLAVAIPIAIQAGQAIINFDFQKTDDALLDELKGRYDSLASIAGESTGRALAGLLIGKKAGQQPVQINMRATATLFLILEEQGKTEIQEEILESLAQLGWAGVRYARQALFVAGYIQTRKWARENFRTGIPEIDKQIESWGVEKNRSWSIASNVITPFVEGVQAKNQAVGNFLEGFLEGFGEGLTDFLLLEYGR